MSPELPYQMALTMVQGVGNTVAKNLISYCGSAQGVFSEKKSFLKKIPNIGEFTANNIATFNGFEEIDQEIKRIEKHKVKTLFYLDKSYPYRLKNYEDSPILMYYRGTADLNHDRIISIVGTRKATVYGKQFTEQLCEAFKQHNVLITSGLASGTDTNAHKYSLKNNIPTVGVLGHGLQTIFPTDNRKLAIEMLDNGGLLTEYRFNAPGVKENFPQRNRIVAGMCDALIVIESGSRGGSLITAEIANGYNKDVYALPGKITDPWSQGCNNLIHQNKAAIIESIDELIKVLGYDQKIKSRAAQLSLLQHLSDPEMKVVNYLREGEKGIDDLHYETQINVSQLALILLDLEFNGIINSLPGKKYAMK
ncbi:MAG: DNA-processing protein DprA [bacterium]|nr:DNA-processing protein DprA [bacterium]